MNVVNNDCAKICVKDKIENDRFAHKVPANDNAKSGFNDAVINVLASSKVFEISDAHGAHSIVSSRMVKSENEARYALPENNLQKCNLDSRHVVVSNAKTSINRLLELLRMCRLKLICKLVMLCHVPVEQIVML